MPTYEFRCEQCGRTFDVQESLEAYEQSKKKGTRCPNCGAMKVEVQLGMVEVRTSKKS